jgi:hypothetical protein
MGMVGYRSLRLGRTGAMRWLSPASCASADMAWSSTPDRRRPWYLGGISAARALAAVGLPPAARRAKAPAMVASIPGPRPSSVPSQASGIVWPSARTSFSSVSYSTNCHSGKVS